MKPDKDLAVHRYYERHSAKVLAWRKRSMLRKLFDLMVGNKAPVFIPFEE